jgi:hypothetical protein
MLAPIKIIPLLVISLILYNVLVFVTSTPPEQVFYGAPVIDAATNTAVSQGSVLFSITMPNGGVWRFHLGDLVLFISLVLLALEVIKATYTRGAGLADQAFSVLLFVVFLVEFLLVEKAATSVFFLLTVMSLIDVIVGAIVGIRTARRDIGFGTGDH